MAGEHCHALSDNTGKCITPNTNKFGVWDQYSEYNKALCDTDCDCIGRDSESYYDYEYARYFCDGAGELSRASFESCDSCYFNDGQSVCYYSGTVVKGTYDMSSAGSCYTTAYTTKEGYNTCRNAVINMGCDYSSFEGVDSYGKCVFTCHLPPVGRSMGGGGKSSYRPMTWHMYP